MFSDSPLPPTLPPSSPNTFSTPFDASYPGTLPNLNGHTIVQGLGAAIALNCKIPTSNSGEGRDKSKISWDRKHYFYNDLTAGFQITQKYGEYIERRGIFNLFHFNKSRKGGALFNESFRSFFLVLLTLSYSRRPFPFHIAPLAYDGHLNLIYTEGFNNLPSKDQECKVRILQIQVEQDTAKSTHLSQTNLDPSSSTSSSILIDLNRSNTPLLEIVSGPDMSTPEQAGSYVLKLQEILRKIGVSDGNMEEGNLRFDLNVSIHKKGEEWGNRCEVKNLNGGRFLMNAVGEFQRVVLARF